MYLFAFACIKTTINNHRPLICCSWCYTEQLTRAMSAVTFKRVNHKYSFIICTINLAEFPAQGSNAVSLSTLITLAMKTLVREVRRPLQFTFSTTESFHPVYLLCSFTVSQVSPAAPTTINDFPAESQVPLPVVGYQLVAQSLAPVGLLHSPDTELGFLLY